MKKKKKGKNSKASQPSRGGRKLACPSLSFSFSFPLSQLSPFSYPYRGLPSKAAISSPALASTMALESIGRRACETARDRIGTAAAEGRDSGGGGGGDDGGLRGAILKLSTLLALAVSVERCVRGGAMVVEFGSEGGKGERTWLEETRFCPFSWKNVSMLSSSKFDKAGVLLLAHFLFRLSTRSTTLEEKQRALLSNTRTRVLSRASAQTHTQATASEASPSQSEHRQRERTARRDGGRRLQLRRRRRRPRRAGGRAQEVRACLSCFFSFFVWPSR